MTRQLLVGDSLTLAGLGEWSTHSGGGAFVTASGGVLTAPTGATPAKFYFYDSYPVTCIKAGQPATFSATFRFGAPTFGGSVIPNDFDTGFERVGVTAKWLTSTLTLAGPDQFSPDFYIALTDTAVSWDIPAAPTTAKYLQLQIDVDGGLGSHFTLYMSSPSLIGLPCSPVRPRLRQFPRDDALGGTPRQGKVSRSVQASTRQGWVGTYR